MSSMKDLFGDTPYPAPPLRDRGLARTTDPQTSHAAAATVDATRLEQQVYLAIRRMGRYGATWDELGESTGIDKASISPRFRPLMTKGLIAVRTENGKPVKRPGKSGKGQQVLIAINV